MCKCERCGSEHDGTFGSGRFCCSYCACTRTKITPYEFLDDERIAQIPMFDDYYATTRGEILRKIPSMFVLVKQTECRRYKRVSIMRNGRPHIKQVHRLVMLAFCLIDNYETMEVNHKDENKSNNNLSNLEWCTRKYNVTYGTALQRMAESQSVPVIDTTTGTVYDSLTIASKATNTPLSNLSACCHGRLKSANGHVWKFYTN